MQAFYAKIGTCRLLLETYSLKKSKKDKDKSKIAYPLPIAPPPLSQFASHKLMMELTTITRPRISRKTRKQALKNGQKLD